MSGLLGLGRLWSSFTTSPRVVRRLGLPASRAPAFPEERRREKEGRKVENEWKAVVPGMDYALPIQAELNELTTELVG